MIADIVVYAVFVLFCYGVYQQLIQPMTPSERRRERRVRCQKRIKQLELEIRSLDHQIERGEEVCRNLRNLNLRR